ncbi:MAG: caspase family protein [Tildeniella nuda ZEHNDER 1965/U140]|jgi:tetratricopeptide (TPR) repeat protein|nr:caspase family protein [Tildeniella nuda ZEHNDER 1965/U140]
MAKIALLIGISEYAPGLNSLPGALKDVEAMQRVLQHPEMGAFAESDIKVLKNPERQEMEEEIQALFDDRHRDDLVLLFFSGHGIKDSAGKFYLSSCKTRKTARGELVRPTATSASFVQENQKNSRSRRQVIILDCCFSGAFAEGMLAKDDGSVDLRSQLGSEGGAVLTSSSSIEYSFELHDSELSVYTRYLIEGLETGDADQDRDGFIAIGELHEYAKRKVQEVVPGMKPEIYPSKEGYNIKLAHVPSTDPALRYRREIERLAYLGDITFAHRTVIDSIQAWLSMPLQDDVRMSSTRRKMLNAFSQKLGLSPEVIRNLESESLQPYRDFYKRLESYEQELINYLKREKPLKDSTRRALKELQHALHIPDEHASAAEQRVSKRINGFPYLRMQTIQNLMQFKFPTILTYVFFAVLAFGTSVYLVQIFQFRQESTVNSIDSAESFPSSTTPFPNISDSIPVSPSLAPSGSSIIQSQMRVHKRNGIDQYEIGYKSNPNIARNYYQRAIDEFSQAIKLARPETEDPELYLLRGNAYLSSSDRQHAIQDYTAAINFSTDNTLLAKAYEWRGDAHNALSNKQVAIEDYQSAIKYYGMQSMASDMSNVQNKLQKLQVK